MFLLYCTALGEGLSPTKHLDGLATAGTGNQLGYRYLKGGVSGAGALCEALVGACQRVERTA